MTLKEAAIKIIESSFGDDWERVERYFSHYTPSEMQEEFGRSGKTPHQILNDYKKDRQRKEEILRWVKNQKDEGKA